MNHLASLVLLALIGGCGAREIIAPLPRLTKPPAAVEDNISVYFSPRGGAMEAIHKEIDAAQKTIDVQAYLITAQEIVDALKHAQDRGVKVRIILDKNNAGGIYSNIAFIGPSGLRVWRDGKHHDMHDKIMLFDGKTIITGSFNFTDQSEDTNCENLLILRGKPALFAAYQAHFEEHLAHSDPPVQPPL